jgi:hypothetical protein
LLGNLSKKGVDVRLITSKVDYNIKALELLKAYENSNLSYLVLDKENEKTVFIHAKIYLIDKRYAVSGSANLTFSGFNTNVESLSIAETELEVQQIERDFMNLWLKYEKQSLSKEQLSKGTAYSISCALPLNIKLPPGKKNAKLMFYPYFFFEYIFRGSVRNPPLIFEDRGLLAIDGRTRQIAIDPLLVSEINNRQPADYVLHTENQYGLEIIPPIIASYKEAHELALDYIIKRNTKEYYQEYGTRSYKRLYVPRKYEITFLKNYSVNVPIWQYDALFTDGLKHHRTLFGSSGVIWSDDVFCPVCQRIISFTALVPCSVCGKVTCRNCSQETGLIFKKKFCPACFVTSR